MASFECPLRGHTRKIWPSAEHQKVTLEEEERWSKGQCFQERRGFTGKWRRKGLWLGHGAGMARQVELHQPHLDIMWMNMRCLRGQFKGRAWSYFYPQDWGWSPRVSQGAGMSVGSINPFYTFTHQSPSWAPRGVWEKQSELMTFALTYVPEQPLSDSLDVPWPLHGCLPSRKSNLRIPHRQTGQPGPKPLFI